MADPTFRWRKQVPQELAQFAIPAPPEALRWPLDRNRLDLQAQKGRRGVVQQLYQQLYDSGLLYEESVFEPQSTVVQQIRTPRTIIEQRRATCIDITLLLAGMCLAADLLPFVVILDGHALLAVAMTAGRKDAAQLPQRQAFQNGLLEDLAQLRAWVDDEDYLLVECTGATASSGGLSTAMPEGQGRNASGCMSFPTACAQGARQIDPQYAAQKGTAAGHNQRMFLYMVHVHELQQHGGFPPLEKVQSVAKAEPAQHNQIINNHASNQGAQGNFYGPVTFNQQGAAPQPSAPSDPVEALRQRLDTQRETLASYLHRLAIMGRAHASPEISHGIREARREIQRIKGELRRLGASVDDRLDDTEEPV